MRIPKIKKVRGEVVLNELANAVANANLDVSGEPLAVFDDIGYRRSLAVLHAENVEPIFKFQKVFPGTRPTADYINRACREALIDIQALFGIAGSLGKAFLDGHNTVVRREQAMLQKIRELRGSIGTLRLYNGKASASNFYKKFSFETQSELVLPPDPDSPQCVVSSTEGALTLPPVKEGVAKLKVKNARAVGLSNGIFSSTGDFESGLLNTEGRSGIGLARVNIMSDGDEHTWFLYGRPPGSEESTVLELELELEKIEIANRIIIRPVNFGTMDWVSITDIKVSATLGSSGESIKDEIQSEAWTQKSNLSLSRANSSDPSIGQFSFLPRRIKSVTISLSMPPGFNQRDDDAEDQDLSSAIGIREISIERVKYGESGEFLFKQIDFHKEVFAVGVLHNILEARSGLDETIYSVSADRGATWSKITPLTSSNTDIGEVVEFDKVTKSILLRGEMKRSPEGFLPEPDIFGTKVSVETFGIPRNSSRKGLESTPETKLSLGLLGGGTVGYDFPPTIVGLGKGSSGEHRSYPIPYAIDRDLIQVFVDGVQFQVVQTFTEGQNEVLKEVLYDDTPDAPRLIFGSSAVGLSGEAAAPGVEISIRALPLSCITSLEGSSGMYKISPPYPAAKDPSMTKIHWVPGLGSIGAGLSYAECSQTTLTIPPGEKALKIDVESSAVVVVAVRGPSAQDPESIIGYTRIGFQNGETEFEPLQGNNIQESFSVDMGTGEVYLAAPARSSGGAPAVTVEVHYKSKIELTSYRYLLDENSIIITDPNYTPSSIDLKLENFTLKSLLSDDGSHSFIFLSTPVVPGTIRSREASGVLADALRYEVPYINGAIEFQDIPELVRDSYFSVNYTPRIIQDPLGLQLLPEDTPWSSMAGATIHRAKGFEVLRTPDDINNDTIGGDDPDNPSVGIRFLSSDLFLSYRIAAPLEEGRDFTRSESSFTLNSGWTIDVARFQTDFLSLIAAYDIAIEPADNSELLEFYSPILRDLALIGTTVDPRLSNIGGV